MVSADTLRRAAAVLRERAEAATPGPWEGYYDDSSRPFWGVNTYRTGDQVAMHDLDDCYEERHGVGGSDAYYIATMHPGVGLALADWLSFVEQRHGPAFLDRDEKPSCNYVGCYENAEEYPCEDAQAAIAVARLILGEES